MKGDGLSSRLAMYLSIVVVLVSIQFAASAVKNGSAVKPVDPNTLKCKVYNLTLKITNVSYEDSLATPGTPQYNKLRIEVEVGVMQAYDGYKPFIGVSTSSFSKAQDGKVLVQFLIEFSGNATEHLKTLTAAIATGKLGTKLTVDKTFKQAACYKAPPPPICPMPCSSMCAPSCMPTCCQQYQPAPVYMPPPPPPQPIVMPQQPACGASCPSTCAPACSSACCNTVYRPQYGKRHHAPHPKQGTKKTHISHLHKLHKGRKD